jgi:hypothetical protein
MTDNCQACGTLLAAHRLSELRGCLRRVESERRLSIQQLLDESERQLLIAQLREGR